ncbi:MAG: glycoside hydrolase family 76 protein [Acidimicrobiales bacterium]
MPPRSDSEGRPTITRRRFVQAGTGLAAVAGLSPQLAARALAAAGTYADRALTTAQALQTSFAVAGTALYRDQLPWTGNPYSYLWPFTQVLGAALDLQALGLAPPMPLASLLATGLPAYRDGTLAPPGYASYVVPPLGGGGDLYYDDNAWVGLDLVRASDLLGDTTSLTRAQAALTCVLSGWDTDPAHPFPGGVFWTRASWNHDRNTVSNAPSAELALGLFQRTGQADLLDWGRRLLGWVRSTLRDPVDGLYWDHVALDGTIETTKWSYNQGTVAGAELLLWRVTRSADPTGAAAHLAEAEAIAAAALARFGVPGGYLTQDPAFNAIFFRNLLEVAHATADTALCTSIRTALEGYADTTWSANRGGDGLFRFPAGAATARLIDQAAMVEVNALAAMAQSLPGVPTAPGAVTATPAMTAAQLTWSPADPNGSALASHDVERQPGGVVTTVGDVTSTTVGGLSPLVAYTFRIRATNGVGPGPWSPATAPVVPAAPPGRFTALPSPVRILDTRTGPVPSEWTVGQPLPGGTPLDLVVDGVAGVPADATGVVLNVTAVLPTATSHLTVWPTGAPMPLASNLNFGAGQVVANLVMAKPGDGGRVSVHNNSGAVHVVLDVTGYTSSAPSGSIFSAVVPTRVLDSRDGTGGYTTGWGPATTRPVTVAGGTTPVPADATAVVVNLTGVLPTATTHLTVWPTGQPMPTASNLNLPPGDVRPNLVIAKVGTDGTASIYNNSGTLDVVADVVGWFGPSGTGGLFTAVQPARVLDSRDGTGGYTTGWGPATTRPVTVAGGTTPVPADATAVVVNLTGVLPTATTHLTVWPTGQPMPTASNLNLPPGDVRPNLVIAKVGTDGTASIYNNSGTLDVVADVVGWFS